MADDVNFFDQTAEAPRSFEPPLPQSEDDYGENVVALPVANRGKRQQQAGWKNEWQLADNGSPLPNLINAMITLRNHPKLSNIVKLDDMTKSIMIMSQIPGTAHDPSIPRQIKDADVLSIQEELQLTGLRRITRQTAEDAINLRAEQSRYHPVLDYLNGLVWDGEKRIYGWLGKYLGVEGSPYSDKIGELFLIAMVARQYKPGCKADYMLILEGPQGEGKSTACGVLAGQWFSDNLPDLSKGDPVRLSMHLRGKWLIEIAELSSFSNAESHTLKEFLSQTEERYTPKYGRQEVHEPRQCLFIGTTNEGTYLRDSTGARRFWPVIVGIINLIALAADRDQLFAEAVHMFKAGAKWWPDRDFEAEHIAPQQAARYEEDPWREAVERWVQEDNVYRCTTAEILRNVAGLGISQIGTREQRRVAAVLKRMGWVSDRSNGVRYYERPVPQEQ